MEKAKVYFTREITPEAVIRVYELLGKELQIGRASCRERVSS